VAGGGRIEKFRQPLMNILKPQDLIGLAPTGCPGKIFPSFANTRRQSIRRLVPTPRDRSFVSRQKNKAKFSCGDEFNRGRE